MEASIIPPSATAGRPASRPPTEPALQARTASREPTGTETETEGQQMPGQEHRTRPRIVAGVDGSPSSVSALRWAIWQAGLTGAAVDAVIAWHYPPAGGYGWAPTGMEGGFGFEENAEKVLADAISAAASAGSDVPVRARVAEGIPAQVLLDACEGAGLLVVGSRGHGGFAEALLGSVSQHCVHHAHCPVVVIRGQEHD
jgi:nucleotide-binding universal stress UspA family protein